MAVGSMMRRAALPIFLAAVVPAAALKAPPLLGVCRSKTCSKQDASTLEGLHILASASEEANDAVAATTPTLAIAATQTAFAASRVEKRGCLGSCGKGPNVLLKRGDAATTNFGISKTSDLVVLLEDANLRVPEPAQKAWLRRTYAVRALRRNKPGEARALLTEALGQAGALKSNAAALIAHLLELRADVAESQGDGEAAEQDRARSLKMRSLTHTTSPVMTSTEAKRLRGEAPARAAR